MAKTGTGIGALAIEFVADVQNLIQGFDKADKAVGKFTTSLNRRLIEPLAKVGAAAAAAAAGVAALTMRATNMAEALAKLSEKTGISVEKLSALKYAAYLADVSVEDLARGMNILAKNMFEAQSGSGDAKDAFDALKISVEQQQGVLKTTDQMLLELADKFSRMEDGPGKAALAMKIFGRSGADLIPFLNQGAAGIEKLRQEAEKLGLIIDTKTAKAAQEFNDDLKRLQTTVEAMNVILTGPVVKAWGEVAKAILEAKKNGDGFFETLSNVMRLMISGPDVKAAQKEMAELGNVLVQAQDAVDEARRNMDAETNAILKEGWAKNLAAAEAHLAKVKARMEVLKGSIPLLAGERIGVGVAIEGEEGFVGPPRPKEAAPVEQNKKAVADAAAREQEVRDVLHKVREENDKLELEQIAKQNEERAKLEEEARQERYKQWERDEDERIRQGQQEIENRKWVLEQKKKNEQAFMSFIGNLAGLMNTNSKKLFEIGKIAAMAEAAVKGAKAVMDAWAFGMEVGGPVVAGAMAGAAALNAANLINNIRSQQFAGGGAVAPIAPTQGSSGISPQGLGGGNQAPSGQSVIIRMEGETFGQKQIRNLIEQINEGLKDGGKLVIA